MNWWPETFSGGDPASAVRALVILYALASVVLLYLWRRTRLYPLYLLKTVWVGFTVLAFAWVVMMSLATNQEFALRPAGVFGELSKYPQAFGSWFAIEAWWVAALLWIPLWAAGSFFERGARARLVLRVALVIVTAMLVLPFATLAKNYDWTPYRNGAANYTQAWRIARMGDYFFNSVLVSLCSVGLVTVLGAMAAYALSRLRFPFGGAVMSVLVGSMAIPGFLLVVPLFVMMKDWSIGNFSFMDSRAGLAVLYAATSLPFTIFLLGAFFKSLPGELAESAALDGASPWRIFAEIYFPLAGPGLATAAIFNFLGVWNEYNFALIFLTNPEFKTLPVGLYNLQVSQQYAVNWPALFAGIVILCLPTFLIFVILQERIVAGLTVGAVKG